MNPFSGMSYSNAIKIISILVLVMASAATVFAQAPTIGATNFSVPAINIEGNSLRVNWTRGNGSRVLVVASASSTFGGTGVPADGTDYNPSSAFGSGDLIGAGNFVVYESTGTSVTITGLNNSTIYYFRIYEFNGTGAATQYNTVNVLTGNGTTLFPPTLGSSSLVATPTGNSASLTWIRGNGTRSLVILRAVSAPTDPAQHVNYFTSTFFESGQAVGGGNVVYFNSSNTVNVTNLQPNTVYFYRVVEGNGTSGPVYNLATALTGSFTTGGAPTAGASSFSTSTIEGNSLRVNWTRGNGSNVLVIASLSPTFNGTGVPANGIDYTANTVFGFGNQIGAGNFVVARNTSTNVTITGLVQSTIYYFRIYEFNGINLNTFYSTATVLAGDGTTLLPPTVGATNLITTPVGNTASLTWTRGNGTRSLVILRAGSAPTDPVQYQNYFGSTAFGSGQAVGGGHVIYFNSSNTVNVTNLEPNTVYFYRVVEGNGTNGPVYNLATALTGSFTSGGAPSTGASSFSASNIEGNRLQVNWTRGNGSNVLVIASLSPTFNGTGIPANGTDYVANATFGAGDQIGAGNFVVYRSTGSGAAINGLVLSTTYYFRIYEFNGINFNTVYNTTNVLSGNGTTLLPPTVGSTNLVATSTGNTASLTWTRGNGTRSLVILRAGSAPADPAQYQNYFPSPNFLSGQAVFGGGNVVYFNSSNVVNVTNLLPNTQYFYRVVESNGSSGPVFDLANTLTGSFTTAGAPTLGSTTFGTASIQGNQFSRSFAQGNGTSRLIVARQDLPVAWTPTNGVDYNANSVFGSGDNLGSNTFVIAETTGGSFNTTSLTPATTYHLAVFEFNGTATNTFYLTAPAQVLTGSVTTLSPPSGSAGNFSFTNITGYNATVTFTAGNGNNRIVLVKAGSPVTDVPVSLINYFPSPSLPSAPVLGTSRIVYNGAGLTFNFETLQPNTTYHFAIFEYNGTSGPVYKQADPGIGSFTTLGKPTISPTNLTFSGIEGNRMNLNYTSGNGFGRIVIGKLGSPVDVFPTDLTSYTENATFGTAAAHLGNGNYVLQNNFTIGGNTNTFIFGLAIGQVYHFAIIEYNGTGTQRIYMTGAQALTSSGSTLIAPTVQASNITFTNITATTLTVNWQNGNGNARTVLIRPGQAVQTLPADLTNYWASSNYTFSNSIGTSRVVYDGTASSVNVTQIPPGEYHVAIIEYNGSSGPVYRNTDPLTGIVNVGAKPIVPATNLTFSNIEGNRITMSCTPGDGLSRMLIVKAGSPVNAWPVDFTGYTANSNFGSGSNLGGGNFVIAINTNSFFTVSNLLPNTTYHFAIVEVNGTGATAFYQDPAIVTQANQSTLTGPTIATSSFFANNVTGNRMQLTWTRGNGAGRLIIAKVGSAVDVLPTDLTNYSPNPNFGFGTNLGGGNFVVYVGAGDNVPLTNLQPSTTYHYAFFEYNGGSGQVYLTTSIGRASFATAPRPSVAPKNLSVSAVEGDRFNLSFATGNGTRRLVVLRKGGLVTEVPVDLTSYTGGTFGAGTLLANGNYVTTIGDLSSTFMVQGLEPNSIYGVAVFEVDGSIGNERYLVTEYINQIVSTAVTPTISTNALLYNSLGSTSVNLSWTNGNGQGRMVVLVPSQPVTFVPTVLSTHGGSSPNFSSTFNNLPASHKHIYRGAATTVTITNLLPGTTYHLALFEYNGAGQPVYTSIPLRGFFTTLPAGGIAIGGFDAITFCPLQQVDVPYVSVDLLNAGNQLSVELSDITGSFASPLVLGTQSTTNTTGFITSTLPASLTEGIGYRLRVRASNPSLISANNGTDLQIATSIQPTFTVVGGQVTTCGDPIQLTTSQPNYNLQWFRNGQPIALATESIFAATQSGSYQVRISGASGGCQLLSLPTALTITQRPNFILGFESAYCINSVVDLAALTQPLGGTFSGPGISGSTFNATTAGIGQHLINYVYIDPVSLCSFTDTKVVLVSDVPAVPVATGASGCQLTNIILSATGADPTATYRWYTTATGGTAIAGQTTATYSTPQLTTTTTYYVSIVSSIGCESPRTAVTATVTITAQPTVAVTGTTTFCSGGSTTLTAPAGFTSYTWSSGQTTESITVSIAGSYTVTVTDAIGCVSVASDAVNIIVNSCNGAPIINATLQTTTVGQQIIIDLLPFLSDPDNDIDLTTLQIVDGPESQATAEIIGNTLVIDYGSTDFSGLDRITIKVCDASLNCIEAVIEIQVDGELIVYNGISPNTDGKNDAWIIKNIAALPETRDNKVTIFNRWGSKVFEVENYNNTSNVFKGLNDNGNELPSGTYFYKILFSSGREEETGYLTLKR